MRAFVLGLALGSAPVAAAERQQFDLICEAPNATEHYRVDLERGEWCFDKCEFVQKVASATSGLITLAEHKPEFGSDRTSYNRINRATGQWEWFSSDPKSPTIMDHKGKCDAAPFSGMPAAKF